MLDYLSPTACMHRTAVACTMGWGDHLGQVQEPDDALHGPLGLLVRRTGRLCGMPHAGSS